MSIDYKEKLQFLSEYLSHGHSLEVFPNGESYLIKDCDESIVYDAELFVRLIEKMGKLK